MKSVIVFYHKGTVDGKTSAHIMKLLLPDAEYFPIDFTNSFQFERVDTSAKNIYVLGFPMQKAMWDSLDDCSSVTYISSQSDYAPRFLDGPNVDVVDTNGESTFVGLWHHLFSGKPLPLIYQHINKYLKTPHTSNGTEDVLGYYLCNILSFRPTLGGFSEKLAELSTLVEAMHLSTIYAEGNAHSQTIKSLASHILEASADAESVYTLFGVKTLIVNIPKIFNVFIKEYLMQEYDNLLTYCDVGDKRYWAFHSKEVDALEVARLFNGFGSSKSSGFTTDQSITYSILNEEWEKSC